MERDALDFGRMNIPRLFIKLFVLLRGFIIIIPTFILLPSLIGDLGLWLAFPVSELLTLTAVVVYVLCRPTPTRCQCCH